MKASLVGWLDRLEGSRPPPSALAGAARGEAEMRRLGIDLSKLTDAELSRLETLARAWRDDGTWSTPPRSTQSLGSELVRDWVAKMRDRLAMLPELAQLLGDTLALEERARLRQLALDWPPERGDPPRELVRA
jgi:hypothetical protein